MLNIPELAMNPNRKVTTKCYGEVKVWAVRSMTAIRASTFSFRTGLTTAPMKMMRRTSHEAL